MILLTALILASPWQDAHSIQVKLIKRAQQTVVFDMRRRGHNLGRFKIRCDLARWAPIDDDNGYWIKPGSAIELAFDTLCR